MCHTEVIGPFSVYRRVTLAAGTDDGNNIVNTSRFSLTFDTKVFEHDILYRMTTLEYFDDTYVHATPILYIESKYKVIGVAQKKLRDECQYIIITHILDDAFIGATRVKFFGGI